MRKKIGLLTLVLGVCLQSVMAQGKYVSGDFHQHTTYTDGSYTIGYMMDKNAFYGLDWWANSEHGGGFNQWATVSGADLGTQVKWENTGITLLGTPNNGKMWRWQSLRDWSFRDVELYRKVYPTKLIIQGFEWNAPGHEHVDVAIIDSQFIATGRNCNPLAEFEYKFDNSDADSTNPNGWVKSATTGKAKTLEAVTWMQTNYPNTSWIIPTHPERANKFKIEDFRNMNNAGPTVCFGFDSQPGHQKTANRGGLRTTSYGATAEGATWGGTGAFAAHIGGVWDALLSEGRKWWLFANSDAHVMSEDFFPGEYQKTKTFVTSLDAQSIVDGLRSGNSYIVTGDLIDSLSFKVGTATMGQTFNATTNTVTVSIIVRDPQGTNNNTYSTFTNPELDHIDIIAGVVGNKIDPSSPDYTKGTVETTKVVARFGKTAHTDANGITTQIWTDLGNGVKQINYTFTLTSNKMYLRLRGTHHAFGAANTEIDDKGNPLVDNFGENTAAKAFEDLWFYSNPIFVETTANTSAPAPNSDNAFSVYPNPTDDILNVEMGKETSGKLAIYDMGGKQVMNVTLNNEKSKQISTSSLAKGNYVVRVNDFSQQIIVK